MKTVMAMGCYRYHCRLLLCLLSLAYDVRLHCTVDLYRLLLIINHYFCIYFSILVKFRALS